VTGQHRAGRRERGDGRIPSVALPASVPAPGRASAPAPDRGALARPYVPLAAPAVVPGGQGDPLAWYAPRAAAVRLLVHAAYAEYGLPVEAVLLSVLKGECR
jgi:hypothetical protein